MVGYIEKSAGGDFQITPEGVHLMVCSKVIDLGTHVSTGQFAGKKQRKVAIVWELPEVRVEIDGKDAPALHTERYTWSMHEKANLRKTLEAWRGKNFTEADFSGPPDGFHIKNVIGVPCMGQIMHDQNGDKTYANIKTLMQARMKREDWPQIEGPTLFFDLDDFDERMFNELSDYWKGLIADTPEYQQATGGGSQDRVSDNGGGSYGAGGRPNGGGYGSDMDDDIPFQCEGRI